MEEKKEEIENPTSSLFKEKEEDSLFAKKQDSLDSLTPKIALAYSDFKFIDDSEYYRTFEAVSKSRNDIHTIRVLNVDSNFYKANPNLASTLFVQEFLRLCITSPNAAFIETFEINGSKISYAMQHCQTLQSLLDKKSNPNDVNIEYLLKDVLSDVSFLLNTLKLSERINIELQNINYIWSTNSFILSDWGKNKIEKDTKWHLDNEPNMQISNGAEEVNSLGMKVLEFHGIPKQELKELELLQNIHMYNGALDSVLAYLNPPAESKTKLKKTLLRDVSARMKLDELAKDQGSRKENEPPYGNKIKLLIKNTDFRLKLEGLIKEFESNPPSSTGLPIFGTFGPADQSAQQVFRSNVGTLLGTSSQFEPPGYVQPQPKSLFGVKK